MSTSGFILLHRSLQGHWLWQRKPFSHGQAWVDLLMLAAFHPHEVRPGIHVERGALWTTTRFLAKRWGWSKDAVSRFIRCLESGGMVQAKRARRRDSGGTVIFIANYDHYQTPDRATECDTNAPQMRQTCAYPKEGKQGNKEIKNYLGLDSVLDLPDSLKPCEPTIREWLRYKAERRETYKPFGFRALTKRLESLGGVERVTAAIQFSMSNNYAGVFPAKENRNEQVNTSNPARIAAPAGKYAKVGVRATTSGFTGARTEQQS